MKFNDINSSKLLPRFAKDESWTCHAFDEIIKALDSRLPAASHGISMKSIEAMTDEELQQAYKDLDLVIYYPDLPRSTRNRMLYLEYRMLERLGTPKAIETMVQYIFGETPITLKIHDNLAFDEPGNLKDETLLDMFDATIDIQEEIFSEFELARLFENIKAFCRDSQELRHLYFLFNSYINAHISRVVEANGDVCSCIWCDSNALCKYVGPTPPDPPTQKFVFGYFDIMSGGDEKIEGESIGVSSRSASAASRRTTIDVIKDTFGVSSRSASAASRRTTIDVIKDTFGTFDLT